MRQLSPYVGDLSMWPEHTANHPIRLLFSACLMGEKCGVDGSSYGNNPILQKLVALPNVQKVQFCPEHFSFGTPRSMPDIHNGNGFDVLDGTAKVFTEKGEDWTDGMINAAHEMLKVAKDNHVDLAIMMDLSAACGTQAIFDGCRLVDDRKYQKGPGVCAALLIRNGFHIVSQRDYKTLELIIKKLDPTYKIDESAIDLHETDYYINYFGES